MIGIWNHFQKTPRKIERWGGENFASKRGQYLPLSCDSLCHNQSHYLLYPVDGAFDAKTYSDDS